MKFKIFAIIFLLAVLSSYLNSIKSDMDKSAEGLPKYKELIQLEGKEFL